MEVKASAKYIRMSPRKVRLVLGIVRGMPVAAARQQLQFMNKAAAEPVGKLINSAVANALNNFGLSEETLKVKTIVADGGPILYRYRPRAMGRSAPIRKRTTHITVVLEGDKVKSKADKE
ncbi:MAG: 50S ribosomal protein L22 [Patescibacteria group bacterium]